MAVMVAELTMGFGDFAQFFGRASGRGAMASSTLCSDSREPGAVVCPRRFGAIAGPLGVSYAKYERALAQLPCLGTPS